MLAWINQDPELARLETTFYRVLTFGSGAMIIAAAQVSFFTGREKTRVVMFVDITATLLNAGLDYAWIFGHCGFSAHGIAGAAWATTTAQWFRVLVYGWLMLRPASHQVYQLTTGWRPRADLMRRLWRYGGPGGLQTFMEVAAFTVFLLLVGRLGEVPLAASALAFTINNTAWVPMWGLGTAVTAIVGQQLGRNRPDLAARATWTALGFALAYMGTMALCFVAVPDWFLIGPAAGTSAAVIGPLRATDRRAAAFCRGLLPAGRLERGFRQRDPRRRRHAIHPLDDAGHIPAAALGNLVGPVATGLGPALVLDRHHGLGLRARAHLFGPLSPGPLAGHAGHRTRGSRVARSRASRVQPAPPPEKKGVGYALA